MIKLFFLGCIPAAWMVFDGLHALWRGDYVTPKAGAHAGALGAWANIVEMLGIDPRSLAKVAPVALGALWFAMSVAFGLGFVSRAAMAVTAAMMLWYLPFGTAVAVVQIALILLFARD